MVTRIKYERSGPGKFSDNVAEFLYDQSMDWRTDELGDVQDFGWYGLLMLGEPIEVVEKTGKWRFVAAILTEDNYGFVDYETFETEEEAKAKWAEIEAEYAEFSEEAEQEESEGY